MPVGTLVLVLAEVAGVRGDYQKQTGDPECRARNDHPDTGDLQRWDFGGDDPNASEEDQQVADFRDSHTRMG